MDRTVKGGMTREQRAILRGHLRSSCFPRVAWIHIRAINEALKCVNNCEHERVITLFNGNKMTAAEIIDDLDIYCFVKDEALDYFEN